MPYRPGTALSWPAIHRHDWIHSLLPCRTAFLTVQLSYNTSDRPLPTGKYQSAIPATSSPGQNPDCCGGDWESSCVWPEAGPRPIPFPRRAGCDHSRPFRLVRSGCCSRASAVPSLGPPAAAGESCRPFPDQPWGLLAAGASLHVQHELPNPTRQSQTRPPWATLQSTVRGSPELSLEQKLYFHVSLFKPGAKVHFILPNSPSARHPPENFNTD